MDAKVDDILSFADIGEFVAPAGKKLFKRKCIYGLLLVIVTQLDPDILIIDEALSVGDNAPFSGKMHVPDEKDDSKMRAQLFRL
ncbi:MAG: hypothetical protein U5Q03_00825 [Bacteroidota bacterium]|nr:hypothetical protein [Bacteroidota bacterium]